MSNKVKDTRLEEKEEMVIHGTILADEFRDRATGKKIDPLGNKVTIDEIDSGNAPEDAVIMANGEGGASWVDLKHKDVHVQSINASQGAAITGPLAVTGNAAVGGDFSVNGDAVAKTLKQTQANYSYSFEISSGTLTKVGSQYTKVEIVNGELHIIGNALFKNETGSSTSMVVSYQEIELPEDIGSKIFDMNETPLNETPVGAGYLSAIRYIPVCFKTPTQQIIGTLELFHRAKNTISLYSNGGANIADSATGMISFECNMSLF